MRNAPFALERRSRPLRPPSSDRRSRMLVMNDSSWDELEIGNSKQPHHLTLDWWGRGPEGAASVSYSSLRLGLTLAARMRFLSLIAAGVTYTSSSALMNSSACSKIGRAHV